MSKAQDKLISINCTECSAPIDLHGGRHVKSISCSYCGAVMDNKDEFKVLDHFYKTNKPFSPLNVGQQGKIKGIQFTVIGMIKYNNGIYWWLDYQLFSPTHGYAWLTYEDGHFVFSHRVRYRPYTFSHEIKSTFSVNNRHYKVYDSYTATVTYVEGELTWIARKGDKSKCLDGIDPPYIFTIEKTEKEEEYSLGEYIAAETIYRDFKIKDTPKKPLEIHPAQVFEPGGFITGLSYAGKKFAVACVAILLILMFIDDGEQIFSSQISPQEYKNDYQSQPFTITDANKLIGMYFHSNVDNNWAYFDVTLHKEGSPSYSLGKEISYYHGHDSEGSWTEGSTSGNVYFKVDEPGTYTFTLEGSGGMLRPVDIEIREGIIVTRYFVILSILFTLSAFALYFKRQSFEAKKWQDEDDDE